ncbi:retrotransposon protein, putative, ty1-copia subclass [Tanacetum coccineum]
MVLGIAPMAIIDRQLPFEYTIISRSTDVVVMAQPVQNINHSAFKSMFEREKLFGNKFNDWFLQLKLVLRVEKKMYVIEQPLPAAPAADSEAQVLFENSSPYDMIKELKSMFEKQAGVERFDLIQTFHACKQDEGKPVVAYVMQMKGYVDQLERLGYMLPQDLIVGLILNGLTKDFARSGNDKQVYIPKPKNPKPSAKEHPTKDDTCHHYKEVGLWKRNCPVYLAELLNKKKQVGFASSSSIFTIELFAFPNKSWVYDTGYGTYICITKHGFREARKLKQGGLYLYVGNGVRVQVEAIGSYDLILPNGLVICLDSCHYAHSITRGVVSDHCLVENGFVQCFTDFGISVSKNNHCRFAHISKKRIEKLQQEGILKSTDDESFDQCVFCLSGKMTRKLFPHRPERATDLLGIIHTDVYGPLRHVSRQGASYFITFTDDYSHYGSSIRSGGEYINQEFKDYLNACGIVQQLTPPYTPQHNGVSERRNCTLLDMVRSIMNLTTPPLSFWDYALESATRIVNMVPTKKVDKTPCEL